METLPYFFELISENKLIQTAVQSKNLVETDLCGLKYKRRAHEILLKNFYLDSHECFQQVSILFSSYGVLIDFVSRDDKYFENSWRYFNTHGIARTKPPYVVKNKMYKVKSKRIVNAELFNKTVHGTLLTSELYGCKIMLSFA